MERGTFELKNLKLEDILENDNILIYTHKSTEI